MELLPKEKPPRRVVEKKFMEALPKNEQQLHRIPLKGSPNFVLLT